MAGVTAQGATFSFSGATAFGGLVTSISVETPVAEVVDMTAATAATGTIMLVPTGDWSGGRVSVDYIARTTTQDIKEFVRNTGVLSIASAGFSVSRNVIFESGSMGARTGELVSGSMTFRITDYKG
jgi:hypothetical protein